MSSNGVTIPQPLLLDKLRTAVNNEQLEIKALTLSPEKARCRCWRTRVSVYC